MNLIVLTTQTLHHTYFIRELEKAHPIHLTLVETNPLCPPFETHHPFEDDRDDYERKVWFDGESPLLSDFTEVKEFASVNEAPALSLLKETGPHIILVFGTGRLSNQVISVCPDGIINLHGGDPEYYRGLDSHLWALYHHDFRSLKSTLHLVDQRLDTGDIILQTDIDLVRGMPIYALRRYNTEACIRMAVSALDMHARFGRFISRKQRKIGRYYSFMPAVLKEKCKKNFKEFTNTL